MSEMLLLLLMQHGQQQLVIHHGVIYFLKRTPLSSRLAKRLCIGSLMRTSLTIGSSRRHFAAPLMHDVRHQEPQLHRR